MLIEEIRELYRARPFRPFFVATTDGRRLPVKRPEFMLLTPSGRTLLLGDPGFTIIDVMLINSVFVKERSGKNGQNGHSKKRRKR